jgi:hypothetical protein
VKPVVLANRTQSAVADALYCQRRAWILKSVNPRIRKVLERHYPSVFVADWALAQTFGNRQESGVFGRSVIEFIRHVFLLLVAFAEKAGAASWNKSPLVIPEWQATGL